MSEERDDLPELDPDLAAWLAESPRPTMPDAVWNRLAAALAAEPPLVAAPPDGAEPPRAEPAPVVSLAEARERRAARRWLPAVGAAAGVVLVGAVTVPLIQGGIAAGPAPQAPITAASVAGDKAIEPSPDGSAPLLATATPTPTTPAPTAEATPSDSPTATPTGEPTQAPATEPTLAPARVVLASGTDYSPATLTQQVDGLLATTGFVDGAQIATVQTTPMPTAAPVVGTDGFTANPIDMSECLSALAETSLGMPALVVDRARYDGSDAAVVVMVHSIAQLAAGPEVTLDVFVVGPECSEEDRAKATWYLHAMP